MAISAPQRSVLSLALPALVVLAAEPLYLLVDTAAVGNLGTVALGGLAVGGGLLAWSAALLNFLAYGTTARAARRAGAGDRAGAVAEGVQATWLAAALGVMVLVFFQLAAGPLTRLLAGGAGPVAEAGEEWLRIASLGLPLLLVSLAGNGWLRGVQELRRPVRFVLAGSLLSLVLCPLLVHVVGWGLVGSAVANVAGQSVTAALFLRALAREGAAWRPRPASVLAQLVIGRDLLLRAAVLQVSFLVAAGVAARTGTAELGAHQIALQLFFFLALVLDAYAIAAQTLVGHALGAGRPADARATARRVARWGLGTGVAVAAVLLALRGVRPAAVHRRPRRRRPGAARLVVPRRHAAAGRGGVRPRRRAHGRRRRRLPADAHRRLGRPRLPAAVAAVRAAGLGAGRCLDRPVPVHRAAAGRGAGAGGR
ncbi:MATE family efflux transporter [Blastococcus sp. TML/C7B]|uniref:MATE family efflux transporter n=1 Tax=Blastococcus sp. TML/C7B TaxID=2798728 RepID=UPI001F5B4A1C|nr:MATE family efflux transporter [Blastococcus sp. TML/C7B]